MITTTTDTLAHKLTRLHLAAQLSRGQSVHKSLDTNGLRAHMKIRGHSVIDVGISHKDRYPTDDEWMLLMHTLKQLGLIAATISNPIKGHGEDGYYRYAKDLVLTKWR